MLPTARCTSEGTKLNTVTKPRRSIKKDTVSDLFKEGLNWDKYLQICNLPAGPDQYFTQTLDKPLLNNFKINQKLEAQDPRNPSSICLATVISLQGPRILLRLDGSDKCNDFWRLIDSSDIYMLGTHESKGILLQPPLGYTRNVSTWNSFLAKNRIKDEKVPEECFLPEPTPPDCNMFEVGMKLEAVDKKNPDMICPATIGEVKGDQIFVSFDGWRGAIDFWCHYTSRDVFPVGWCNRNDHPLTNPGIKGDNPAVVARLKKLIEESKRQTRSGSGLHSDADKSYPGKTATYMSHATNSSSNRGKYQGRTARSLTPVLKKYGRTGRTLMPEQVETSVLDTVPSPQSCLESSAEEDTCDSSSSSSSVHSSDCSISQEDVTFTKDQDHISSITANQNQNEPTGTLREGSKKEKICEEGTEFVAISSNEEKSLKENNVKKEIDEEKRLAKKASKKKKKEKRKLKKYSSKYTDATFEILHHSHRKRYKSMGDEEYNQIKIKKRKKRQNRSVSSIHDSFPRKRMLGFGVQNNHQILSHQSIQSPSFLDHASSPTSMFGFGRDEIVKEATKGWPSRFLVSGSGKVITSDNKLGRFGTVSVANSSCQTADENPRIPVCIKPQIENIVHGQVTTTTSEIGESIDNKNTIERNLFSTCNVEATKNISSQTVSSTTHPTHPQSPDVPKDNSDRALVQVLNNHPSVTSTAKVRSRNPQRWSVTDVMDFVGEREPALASYVYLFNIHEIDGQALLLLRSEIAVKYMNMKLGPALKLANLVEKIKQLVPPPQTVFLPLF